MLGTWILLTLAGLVAVAWHDALGARERACFHSRRACQGAGLQLLDQTVSLQRIGLAVNAGRVSLRRTYAFEVSTDGLDRARGSLVLLGRRVLGVSLPLPADAPVT